MSHELAQYGYYELTGQAINATFITPYLNNNLEMNKRPHVSMGVQFTDANGSPVTPGAGTYTVTVETVNLPGVFQPIVNGTSVDATAALTNLSCAANISRIKVVSAGITVAALVNLKVTANVS